MYLAVSITDHLSVLTVPLNYLRTVLYRSTVQYHQYEK
jgi:hypothetical protein